MKEEVHRCLEKYFEFWAKERGSLPMVSFDKDCDIKMYVGEIDVEGYIQWNYKERNNIIEFSGIEKKYDIRLHNELKEYYNSYNFLQLEGFVDENLILIEPISDEKDILAELEYIFENEGKDLIQIGIDGKSHLPLCYEVNDGNIIVYDYEKKYKKILSNSLKEFFSKLSPKKN